MVKKYESKDNKKDFISEGVSSVDFTADVPGFGSSFLVTFSFDVFLSTHDDVYVNISRFLHPSELFNGMLQISHFLFFFFFNLL